LDYSDQTVIIIPARWASTRFPGKPLASLGGRPVLQHVWERCLQANLGRVIIATDDDKIKSAARDFGADVVMTPDDLETGTDRCAVVAKDIDAHYIINVQGDEPFIEPGAIKEVALTLWSAAQPDIATLARLITDENQLSSSNVVKVVRDKNGFALYFSRLPIPYCRDCPPDFQKVDHFDFLAHLGIYGFRKDVLTMISGLPPGNLEGMEKLEQLRWMEDGYRIKVGLTEYSALGIDTPEDLQEANRRLS
jgi:3-deoxy-manno-octulosonate cytidylyltransferase (CMP-KDO synthetase)